MKRTYKNIGIEIDLEKTTVKVIENPIFNFQFLRDISLSGFLALLDELIFQYKNYKNEG